MLIITSVFLALADSGDLNKPTPSAIASRPVKDDPPLANALSKIKTAAAESSPCSLPISIAPGERGSSSGNPVVSSRKIPIPNTTNIEPTNK